MNFYDYPFYSLYKIIRFIIPKPGQFDDAFTASTLLSMLELLNLSELFSYFHFHPGFYYIGVLFAIGSLNYIYFFSKNRSEKIFAQITVKSRSTKTLSLVFTLLYIVISLYASRHKFSTIFIR
jgi:hypothetical protein